MSNEMLLGMFIGSFIFTIICTVVSLICVAIVVGFKNSTHKIEYHNPFEDSYKDESEELNAKADKLADPTERVKLRKEADRQQKEFERSLNKVFGTED